MSIISSLCPSLILNLAVVSGVPTPTSLTLNFAKQLNPGRYLDSEVSPTAKLNVSTL